MSDDANDRASDSDVANARFDLVVIGGGSAGLTGATFAAKLGARVALVEKHRIGGDCTWTGCVPSKALLKVARVAHQARRAARFGVEVDRVHVDMRRVRAHVAETIATIYARETPEAVEALGITPLFGAAHFVTPHDLRVGDRTIRASRFLIATGAHPRKPDIPGLDAVPVVTHESLFDNDRLPEHLLVVGAGPIGVEMAQAYRRLGSAVTLIGPELLPREEPEARAVIERVFSDEEIGRIRRRPHAIEDQDGSICLRFGSTDVRGDMLLVAAGRRPNVQGLGLDQAGVQHSEGGIQVDAQLRTNQRHIYAAGDVIGGLQLTHLAGWQAFQAVRNALLPGNTAGIPRVLPSVVFTDPEVARVGSTEREARAEHGDDVFTHLRGMQHTDRAVCEGETEGLLKLVAKRDGTLLGATIVAPHAGEMIAELALALERRLKVGDLAAVIHAYPTWSSATQDLAADVAVDAFLASSTGKAAVTMGRWLR